MKFRIVISLFAAALAQTATQASEFGCAICWDGTIAKQVDGMCNCPPAVIDENGTSTPTEEIEEETKVPSPDQNKPSANPNCTTANVNACKDKKGIWDYIACECSISRDPIENDAGLPPIDDSELPPIEDSDIKGKEGEIPERDLALLKNYKDIKEQFNHFGIYLLLNQYTSSVNLERVDEVYGRYRAYEEDEPHYYYSAFRRP